MSNLYEKFYKPSLPATHCNKCGTEKSYYFNFEERRVSLKCFVCDTLEYEKKIENRDIKKQFCSIKTL